MQGLKEGWGAHSETSTQSMQRGWKGGREQIVEGQEGLAGGRAILQPGEEMAYNQQQ